MPRAARPMSTPTVMRFRGLNKYVSKTALPADWAQDLLNVVINASGNLTSVPTPNAVSSAQVVGECYGFYDYQRSDGLRQVIACFGTKIYKFEWDDTTGKLVPTLVDDNADNAAQWSMVPVNNVLYLANGKRMLKWTGTNLWAWGVPKPPSAPTVTVEPTGTFKGGKVLQWERKAGVTTYYMDAIGSMQVGSMLTVVPYTAPAGYDAFYWNYPAPALIVDPTFACNQAALTAVSADKKSVSIAAVGLPDVPLTPVPNGQYSATITFTERQTGPRYPGQPQDDYEDYTYNSIITVNVYSSWSGTMAQPQPGRSYRVSLVNGLGSSGPGSNASANTGPTTTPTKIGLDDATKALIQADKQITTVVLWSTMGNGGTEYYYNSEYTVVRNQDGTVTIPDVYDRVADSELDKLRSCPLFNFPPPTGRYLAEWGGRIFIASLDGAKADIVYSGYEAISEARPEECYPPGNRLRLAVGADEIRGIGVIQAGVVAMSKSNEMFMFRGIPEDVTGMDPIAYSAVLEKMPWATACGSHASIESTPDGLRWFSASREIQGYNGSGKPDAISLAVSPVLAKVKAGLDSKAVGCYFNYLDRDWYLLAIPEANDSQALSKIVVVDLQDGEDNCGVFIFDVGAFDWVDYVEDKASGRPRLLIAQDGWLKEVELIVDADGGLLATEEGGGNAKTYLAGYWHGGYFGNDSPESVKMIRTAVVEADSDAWGAKAYLVGATSNVANVVAVDLQRSAEDGRKLWINRKARRAAVRLELTGRVSILQLSLHMIPTSVR